MEWAYIWGIIGGFCITYTVRSHFSHTRISLIILIECSCLGSLFFSVRLLDYFHGYDYDGRLLVMIAKAGIGMILANILYCVMVYFKEALEENAEERKRERIKALRREAAKAGENYKKDKIEYEKELKRTLSYIDKANDLFEKNLFEQFWSTLAKAERRKSLIDKWIEKLEGHRTRFAQSRDQHIQLCNKTIPEPRLMRRNSHDELIGRKSHVLSLISSVKKRGESNFQFASYKQTKELHKEKIEQDEKHHRIQSLQDRLHHLERMEKLEEMADAQERMAEIQEEEKRKREEREKEKLRQKYPWFYG